MSDAAIRERSSPDRQNLNGGVEIGAPASSQFTRAVPVFLFSLIIPFLFFVGTMKLSPYRVLLIVMFVPVVVAWVSGKAGRIRWADISVVMLCVWYTISVTVNHGFQYAWQNAGMFIFETLGSYLLARTAIRTADDFHYMVKWFFRCILVLLPFAIYETVTAQNIILKVFNAIGTSYDDVYKEPRWGLDRVQGPFDHPILFGVFSGGALALSYYVLGYGKNLFARSLRPMLVFFTAALTLSSGPVTSFIAQIGMIGWDVLFKKFRGRWRILGIALLSVYVPLEIASNRSVAAVLIEKFAFDPWTGFYRLLIWEYGSASVMNNPFLGNGIGGNWERPSWMIASVDMYWLLWAMQIGIPGAVFVFAALGFMTIGTIRKKISDPKVYDYRLGFLIVMLGFFLAGWTVHYWNATHVLFFFLLGSGGWIMDFDSGSDPAGGTKAVEDRPNNHRSPRSSSSRKRKLHTRSRPPVRTRGGPGSNTRDRLR